MHFPSVATLCLLLAMGAHSQFEKLIRQIETEFKPFTVYLLGVDEEYLKQVSSKFFNTPVVILTYFRSDLSELRPIEESSLLVVQQDRNSQPYHVIEQIVQLLYVRMSVVIIADSHETFKDYCLFFADKNFTKIFGIVNGLDFAYLQYADRPVRQLTPDGSLPDALKDLNGMNFRTTIQTDFPRAFWYQNRKGQKLVGGYVAQILISFFHKHNATFTDVLINNSSNIFVPGVIAATKNGDIDISMNACSKLPGITISYPIKFQKWTILVPLNGYVSPHEYFVKPFALTVWIYICLTLVYIIFAHVFNDFYSNEPVNVWTYFSETLLQLLGMPTGTAMIRRRRIHIQVILLSHILVNFYCNHLTSFLTVYIKIRQWNTIPDLIEHKVPLMIPEHQSELIFNKNFPFKDIIQIVKKVNSTTQVRARNSMRNLSFAYTVSMDRAELLLSLQKQISRPLFQTIRDSLHELHLGFLINRHSPFDENLKNCILQTSETGLIDKWTSDATWQGAIAGLLPLPAPPKKLLVPLHLNHLYFAWVCLGIGLLMAVVVFLCEQYRRVFQRRN